MTEHRFGIIAPPDMIARASELVQRYGQDRARIMLGVSREALLQLIAGRGVRRGTLLIVRLALDAMPNDSPDLAGRRSPAGVLGAPRVSAAASMRATAGRR